MSLNFALADSAHYSFTVQTTGIENLIAELHYVVREWSRKKKEMNYQPVPSNGITHLKGY